MSDLFTPRQAVGVLLVVWLALAAAAAPASSPKGKGKSATARSASGARFVEARSGESAAARRARLKAECKGRPNAGACLGLTRGD